jgi:hypothetical protein
MVLFRGRGQWLPCCLIVKRLWSRILRPEVIHEQLHVESVQVHACPGLGNGAKHSTLTLLIAECEQGSVRHWTLWLRCQLVGMKHPCRGQLARLCGVYSGTAMLWLHTLPQTVLLICLVGATHECEAASALEDCRHSIAECNGHSLACKAAPWSTTAGTCSEA